ncbi:exocyst complex component EXO70B1-like [Abrus precatorius]|uniref:Exocyst subunit Exo70 family protein n=1 Tax=Abrus precatorius TaxID=3816 RepID=A0A8B8MKM3_ABRPR|nr:exocyst complex component EXO70B1-like [Abrus precatorius]
MSMLIQILTWLMQPKVWRFVCFTSSVVGLLCYALSSFNHLFGKWTCWKIFLYTVFSFIICISILFAKSWQRSATLRLKAHMAFLVLIITSVYSFFFDKVLQGKPDACSLISCAAFAIMSLTLSRQTHCGFEIDLLYFFSGGLILQLTKIKLWFIIVGASFSYSLIILRSFLDTTPEIGHHQLRIQDEVVIHVDDSGGAIHRVDSAQANTSSTQKSNLIVPHEVNRDLGFQQPFASHSQLNNSEGDIMRSQLVACLKVVKKQNQKGIPMISKRVKEYLKANVDENQIGISPRPNLKLKSLLTLGFQLQELNIENWIKASKVAFRILIPIEKRLCHCVFFRLSSAADISFTQVSKEFTIRLLSFADTFATCCMVPKLFNTLSCLIPDFESLFSGQYSVSLKNEALMVWKRLSVANRAIFVELENFICREMLQTVVLEGGLHPVTYEVMNCLRDVCESKDIAYKQSFQEQSTDFDKEEKSSLVCFQLAWIIELLESNLEAKSKEYRDPALGCVFMMNNLRYIGVKAKEGKMRTVLDKDWLPKNMAKIQKNVDLYQRSSWNRVLDILKLDDNESGALNEIEESMKEKLKLFNLHFEEICNVQSTWWVFDNQLREQTILSLENILLPAYGNFIGRFQDFLGKHAYDYIQYGLLDIQDQLNHLFLVNETLNPLLKEN